MADFPETVGGWLLDLLGFLGLGIGGAAAAAASDLNNLQEDSWAQLPSRSLSPQMLAEMVVKGVATDVDGAHEARRSGINESRFAAMIEMTGNPPGPQDLLSLLRRGIIDQTKAEHGMRQGYLKNEWIPALLETRWDLPTVGELVAAVVQNHMPHDQALLLAEAQGVRPEHFEVLVANAGNPPGPMEMLDLWNRGEVTEAEVDQALRESRLKDKYIAALKRRAIRKLPMRSITTLLTHGALDDATAIRHLRELGYEQVDAEALVRSAHFQKAQGPRELTVAQIRDLYAQHAINRDQAVADLVALRYPVEVANQIMQLAEIDSRNAAHRAAIAKVRTAYDARKITRTEASTRLDELHVEHDQRDSLLDLWDVERDVNVRMLSEAQTIRAAQKKVITVDDCGQRLIAMGYTSDDAVVLMMTAELIPNPNNNQQGAT